MRSLFWNKIAFCVLATGLLMTGLNAASAAIFWPTKIEPIVDCDPVRTGEVEQAEADVIGVFDEAAYLAGADIAAGKMAAQRCLQCHLFDEGAPSLQGPPLFGVLGQRAAATEGYRYSDALNALGESGGEWTYERLDRFIENPKKFAPGTAMNFVGVRKHEERADLVAYLGTLKNQPD